MKKSLFFDARAFGKYSITHLLQKKLNNIYFKYSAKIAAHKIKTLKLKTKLKLNEC